jgi:hypothetical protein
MFKPFCCFIFLSLWIPFGLGCNSTQRPEGLPPLYSSVVTIIQNNVPVADVSVQLISKKESVWTVTGITDASGKAVLVTHSRFSGVPAGDYIVVLSKRLSEQNISANQSDSGITKIYSLIDSQYTTPETSSLEMSIKKGHNVMSFEVGLPVRILVDTIRPGT